MIFGQLTGLSWRQRRRFVHELYFSASPAGIRFQGFILVLDVVLISLFHGVTVP